MSLTSRERITAALEHREPDRTPVFEYVLLSPIADLLLGRVYGGDPANWTALVAELGWEQAVRRNARDRVELALLLGHDMLYVYSPPALAAQKLNREGAPKRSHAKDAKENNDKNPSRSSRLRGSSLSVPPDPVAALQARNERADAAPPPADEQFLIYSYVKEELARRGADLPLLAPAYVHGVWTDVELLQTMLLDPDVAHEHFRLATRRALATIERYAQLGIEMIGVGGDFAGTRPIISPAAYRAFIVPEVRECSRRIHALGRYAVNASDGDLWSVIEDFLLGCEVDGYLEIDEYAGMELGRLKAAYGKRITFLGNLDCGTLLSFAPPDEVRRATLRCLEAGRGAGGHILCASNAIAQSVPLGNYLALVNAYREYWGLPAFRPEAAGGLADWACGG